MHGKRHPPRRSLQSRGLLPSPQADIDFGPDFTVVEEGLGFSNSAGLLELKHKKDRKLLSARHGKLVYFPKQEDNVIGIIVKKNAENYSVDISTGL